jgi:hypothetical protein
LAQLVALALAAPLRGDRFQRSGHLGDAARARDPRLKTADEPLQGVRADLDGVQIVLGQEAFEVGLGGGVSWRWRHSADAPKALESGQRRRGSTMARCEWCEQETDYDRLRPIRDWEEALTGPEYWVCPECVEKEREGFEAASAEWSAYMEERYAAGVSEG